MNKPINIVLILMILVLYSCGTGPWFIQKNLYKIYQEPIYQNSDLKLRTNGFYAQLSDSSNVDYTQNILVFNDKGYNVSLDYMKLQHLIASQTSIVEELDWWRIKNDSIIIENYGETKRLIKTSVWWHKGKFLNDSIFEIAYQDNNYKYRTFKYQFVKTNNIPKLINNARYLKKEWYISNLNKDRK